MNRRSFLAFLASIPFVRHFVAGAPELPKPPSTPAPTWAELGRKQGKVAYPGIDRSPVTWWRATPTGADFASSVVDGDEVRYAARFDQDMDATLRQLNAEVLGGRWRYEGFGRFVFHGNPPAGVSERDWDLAFPREPEPSQVGRIVVVAFLMLIPLSGIAAVIEMACK